MLDEFQEVVEIDPNLPKLMRAVFQAQPEVAHVYLGTKRHMMRSIFNDDNEPFWRSAKQIELGVIRPDLFAPFIAERFRSTASGSRRGGRDACSRRPRGHPYATQELCYFTWEATDLRSTATRCTSRRARRRSALGARALLAHLGGRVGRPAAPAHRARR